MMLSKRRDFLRIGSLGFGGLHLSSLLAADTTRAQRSCIVIFQNGARSNDEPELRPFFRFLVGADVVAQPILKLAHRDLRIDGHWLR